MSKLVNTLEKQLWVYGCMCAYIRAQFLLLLASWEDGEWGKEINIKQKFLANQFSIKWLDSSH